MKTWNTLVPVIALIKAETAGEAILSLRSALKLRGFDVYDGEPGSAFESEEGSEADRHGKDARGS